MDNCFIWEPCGKSIDGTIRSFRAKLEDGTMYLTVCPLMGMTKVYVPDETYVVDDTDYSQPGVKKPKPKPTGLPR